MACVDPALALSRIRFLMQLMHGGKEHPITNACLSVVRMASHGMTHPKHASRLLLVIIHIPKVPRADTLLEKQPVRIAASACICLALSRVLIFAMTNIKGQNGS